ncbi:MAG: hypothetical protein US89_C0005G0101 [Candidatus Peregrinibacteria bacterium GW2011_GWF2_38_29]|nr:MAG: hypothetical protein US89_C0005G0101 [Candidatus Peregrinibacteria bacterium GW2011_GWF2_38_29]HBB02688.1 hypothetical protein [Candidatus Peregrinibacteria bacterium]
MNSILNIDPSLALGGSDLQTDLTATVSARNNPPKIGPLCKFISKSVIVAGLFLAGCGAASAASDDSTDDVRTDEITDVASGESDSDNTFIACKSDEGCVAQLGHMGLDPDCVRAKCTPDDPTQDRYSGDKPGHCEFDMEPEDLPCDDRDLCTEHDICDGSGVCKGTPKECEWDENACHDKNCDPATGECNTVTVGASCDDETQCTTGGKCDSQGECQNGIFVEDTAAFCDDHDTCTTDYCKVGTGCAHIDVEDGIKCGTQDACHTAPPTCVAGECVEAEEIMCPDDGKFCNGTPECDPVEGCKDGDVPPEHAACTDNYAGDLCALESWCVEEQCVTKTSMKCDDDNPCTQDTCRQGANPGCDHLDMPNGIICASADACHIDVARCLDGECVGTGLIDCPDDGEFCNGEEACDPVDGCTHINVPIDGSVCTDNADQCALESACDDGACVTTKSLICEATLNTCETSSQVHCDTSTGECVKDEPDQGVYLPQGHECDDHNSCTTGDHCVAHVDDYDPPNWPTYCEPTSAIHGTPECP